MNGNSKPHAILIFGVPMSGKTQFAAKFSQQFNSIFLDFGSLPDISREAFLAVITQLAASGQTILIEGAVDTQKDRDEIRKILKKAGYKPALVWIQTDVTAVKQRLKTKLKSVEKAKAAFEKRIDELEAPADQENPIVISGKHTFATQLKTVLSQLSKK